MQGVLILILKLGGGGCILKILINNNYYKVVLKLIKEKIEFVRFQFQGGDGWGLYEGRNDGFYIYFIISFVNIE